MLRRGLLLIFGLALLGAVGLGSYSQICNVSADAPFHRRSLEGATQDEIARYAVDYARAQFGVVSGTPRVRLVRSVTTADLPALGLGGVSFTAEEPPLALVILAGDFDVSSMRGLGRSDPAVAHTRVEYVGYLFDLRSGIAALTATSPKGGRFRIALDDPSLPDDQPKVVPATENQAQAVPQPALPLRTPTDPYGSIAPTVVPPSHQGAQP